MNADRRRQRTWLCSRKVGYLTEQAARDMTAMLNRTVIRFTPMEAYPCEFGRHWHLGHGRAFRRITALTVNGERKDVNHANS